MVVESSSLLASLAIGRRRRREREEEENDRQNNLTITLLQQQIAANIARKRRSISPLLPVIHEVDSSDDHSSSCGTIVVVTPERSQFIFNNTSYAPSHYESPPHNMPINYGSFSIPISNSYDEEIMLSSSSSDSDDSPLHEGTRIITSRYRTRQTPRRYTTLLSAVLAVSLSAVMWVPLLREDQSPTKVEVPPSYPPWGYFKQLYDKDNEGRNKKDSMDPSWYLHKHHSFEKMIKMDDSIFGSNYKDDDADDEDSAVPIGGRDIPTVIQPDITFGDLAALLVPPYFQQTIDLCISTISTINTKNITFVMPDQVYLLRKTILKTRDLFDVFSPVYSKHSSLGKFEHIVERSSSKHISWHIFDLVLQSDAHTSKKHRKREEEKEEQASFHDLWKTLRRYLDRGYFMIGEYQDLDHAKIKYTSEQLSEYQQKLWQWNHEFMNFVQENRHHISLYLSLPCKKKHPTSRHDECRHVHSHSSHLFWGNATREELPDGNVDTATAALGKLGDSQLGRAEMYLRDAIGYDHVIPLSSSSVDALATDGQVEGDRAHQIYHNLRKELRSFVDELALFGNLLLPDSSLSPEIAQGNATGTSSSGNRGQQTEQALYAVKRTRKTLGDLNDDYVKYAQYVEWNEFPEEQLQLQTIIEAQWNYFRIWSREVDLFARIQFLRDQMASSRGSSCHDHNTLNKSLQNYQETLTVVEIVDHHKDTHQYKDTCSGKQRNIAFEHNHALVASTTTLVAERLKEYESPPYSTSIGILLLGVILLDSVNLDDSIGKVTDRDRDSVNDLLMNTDWNKAKPSSFLTRRGNGDVAVNTNELFRMLQMAKYDPVFWSQMSVSRSLSYDFKYFQAAEKFGISSILMPGVDFMTKEGFWDSTYSFMNTIEISFLSIMFAYYDEQEVFHRQLLFVYTNRNRLVERSVDDMLASQAYRDADLQLEEVMIPLPSIVSIEYPNLQARLFDQHNVAPSRKQVGPLLEKVLNR